MNLVRSHQDAVHATKCELAAESLRHSGMLQIRVNGWSMLPAIYPGDVVLIRALNGHQVSPGDIVLFQRQGRLFVHRVVRCGGTTVLTRGDAMRAPDPLVSTNELLGRVEYVIREQRQIVPSRKLRLRERTVARLVRRSNAAARFIVGMKRLQQRWNH
jgi:signal peptidase I